MNINFLPYTYQRTSNNKNITPTFGHGGSPLSADYIMRIHSHLLPQRVKSEVFNLMNNGAKDIRLKQVHLDTYAPLLMCKTLDEAKKLFPEFSEINDINVKIGRIKINKDKAKLAIDNNFVLNVLKEYWGKLQDKEDISATFGLSGRWTLDRLLQGSNFVGFHHNYPNLLRASDVEGNAEIAERTKKWNETHPEERRKLNKKAAQGWKNPIHREAQRKRMLQHDIDHPERKQKISDFSQKMWDDAVEVRQAMADFLLKQPDFIRTVIAKKRRGEKLNAVEQRVVNAFYKDFWLAHPEMKAILSKSAEKIRKQNAENIEQ